MFERTIKTLIKTFRW